MSPPLRLAILFIWSSLCSAAGWGAGTDQRVQSLLSLLKHGNPCFREIAESRIRQLGISEAGALAEALTVWGDRALQARLERCFRVTVLPRFQAWRAATAPVSGGEESRERKEKVREIEGKLLSLGPPVWPMFHRCRVCGNLALSGEAERVLSRVAQETVLPQPGEEFDRLRYFLSPVLLLSAGERAEELLQRHLQLTFSDFAEGSIEVKLRAEEELCLLGKRAERFLEGVEAEKTGRGVSASELRRLKRYVKWGVRPELRIRSGVCMKGWQRLSWREKKDFVGQLKSVAGQEAILLLRRIRGEARHDAVRYAASVTLYELGALENVSPPKGLPPVVALRVRLIQVWNLRRRGELEKALDILFRLKEKLPEDRRIGYELGVTLRRARRFQEAVREFKRALPLKGENPSRRRVLYQLAVSLHQMKLHGDAVKQFRKALEAEGEEDGLEEIIWYDLGCAYALSGKKKQAIDAIVEAVKKGYRNREHILHNDPELEGLRDLKEFDRVVEMLNRFEDKP